jgi:multidrug efflux pump subunit AcrA (membrane-fusion protein)
VRTDGEGAFRAEFPNPGASLRPGASVRVRLRTPGGEAALVVPLRALNDGPDGPFVRVVGAAHVIETRAVTIDDGPDGFAVVTGGLRAGEQVVVGGATALRDGLAVAPRPANVVSAGLGVR